MWYNLPLTIPIDGSTVWVRVRYYYGKPFQAVWSISSQSFTSVEGSIMYPAWVVARWRN